METGTKPDSDTAFKPMNVKKKYTVFLLLFLFGTLYTNGTFAQIMILFNGNKSGINDVQALYRFSVRNPDGVQYTAKFTLTLEDEKGKKVMTVLGQGHLVNSGVNNYDLSVGSPNTVTRYSESEAGRFVRANRQLLNGSYTFCIVVQLEGKDLNEKEVEKCFPIDILRFSELNLVYPGDKDNICEPFPTFQWQPLLPRVNGVTYAIKAVEVDNGQSATAAINKKLPFLYMENINPTMINTSSLGRKLVEGKRYAWQVYALANKVQLATSEVWEFIQGCKDSATSKADDNYILLTSITNGAYHSITEDYLTVAFFNPYSAGNLQYSIYDMSDNVQLKNLPVIKSVNGLNKIKIILEDIEGITKGHSYNIQFSGISETVLSLKVKIN